MIPFARIVKYGNMVVESKKMKQLDNKLDTLVLWEDGTLWGCGYNRYGQLMGDSANTAVQKNWVQVSSGVEEIIGSWNNGFAVLMKDGTIMAAGDLTWAALGTQGALQDVTAKLTISGKTIVQYSFSGPCVLVRTSDNVLYGLSSTLARGNLGIGTTIGSQLTLIQLATNVKYCATDGNESFYITTAGKLWCTGWNNSANLGTANSTQINTWQLSPTAPNDVVAVYPSYSLTVLVINTGVVYVCGNMATGLGTAKTTFSSMHPELVVLSGNYSVGVSGATLNTMVIANPTVKTNIYFSGNMTYMGSGTNTNDMGLWSTNYASGILDPATVKASFGYESNIWYDGKRMFFCGQQRYMPGYPSTPANVQFQELQYPPGTELL